MKDWSWFIFDYNSHVYIMFIVLSHYHFHEMIVTPVEYLALCMLSNLSCFRCSMLTFFFNLFIFFKKLFQEHFQCVKRLGSRPCATFCRS